MGIIIMREVGQSQFTSAAGNFAGLGHVERMRRE